VEAGFLLEASGRKKRRKDAGATSAIEAFAFIPGVGAIEASGICSARGDGDVMKILAAILILAVIAPVVAAQESYAELAKRFEYGAGTPPLAIKEEGVQDRGGIKIHDISYASPVSGRVPAYLVVPASKGRFAAILWGHWMMPGSPSANRGEFLEEAIVLAQAGVVSLMIDTPMVRPGFKSEHDPLGPQSADTKRQEVMDLRRGLDLLLARADVDPKRVAYVGHSFNASSGAILDAVDKRPAAFVFMANPVSEADFLTSDTPMVQAFRKKFGDDKIKEYLAKYGWADPGEYAAYLGPSPALFQYATHDEFMTVAMEQKYFDMSKGPKKIKFYEATHSLDAAARRDRYEWLKKQIGIGELPAGAMEKVPETR
jgi:cephalosporin-C deacetylase-like acetyl esterase